MASYNYTFQSGDTLTPTKLNDARTVSEIVNADISATAAIAGTKVAPAFGSQDITVSGADRSITNTGNFALSFGTNNAERMRIDSSGNVGIAVNSPSHRLHIVGNSLVTHANWDASGATANIYIGDTLNSLSSTSGGATTLTSYNSLTFVTGATPAERMRIDASGNVLIGKSTTAKNVDGFEIKVENNNASIEIQKTFNGGGNGILFYHNGTYVGGLNYDNTTTSFVTSSDARLKTNITDAGNALTHINSVRVVSHGWKNDGATVKFGVVAQELSSIFPEAVAVGDGGEEIQKVWGVDYARLVPVLIKSVQELSAKVAALEAAQ